MHFASSSSSTRPGYINRSPSLNFVNLFLFNLHAVATQNKMIPKASLLIMALSRICAAQGDVFYDETWAGPVQLAEPDPSSSNATSPSGFNLAEAILVMPHLQIPKSPPQRVQQYTAAYWVGLDGFLLTDSIPGVRGLWQAGVFMSIFANGSTQYTGFYEWVPSDPISLDSSQLAISEGDHVHVLLNTTNGGYQGSLALTNLNTSQIFSYSQDAPVSWRGPTWPSPGTSAEWIIEAGTYLNGTRHVFPDWGNTTFLDAKACYNTTGTCVLPGQGASSNSTRTTAMRLNATNTLYTRSYIDNGNIWIAYVEDSLAA